MDNSAGRGLASPVSIALVRTGASGRASWPVRVARRSLPAIWRSVVIERNEIESLRSLRRLVRDYDRDRDASKPLCLAVFGPPGAGKSFGVKQVAKAVLGGQTPILEFNLAQFADSSELIGLLHQVRDKVLEGRLPVVFWDEFDAKDLFWLQYLLAPMQDGRFQDGQVSHPIGKCIFVFAGGTSYDFQSFSPATPAATDEEQDEQRWEHFKARKGPDFVSRLSGFLNVLGPNQRQFFDPSSESWQDDPADVSYPLRRALFVRAKLTRSGDQRLAIDRGVLTALLQVKRYVHGSRSLEKILEQIRQRGRTDEIVRSDLPPPYLLALHVDAKEFGRLVESDVDFQGDVEAMAAAYHEFYRELAHKKGWVVKFDVPYAELPEDVKDENRAAARRIAEVLALAGLYLVKAEAAPAQESADIKAILLRNLDSLAEAEHEGWMKYKFRQGWRRAANRDDEQRLHNILIPYHELPEKEKEKDRNAVQYYPEIAAREGYRIVSEPPTD